MSETHSGADIAKEIEARITKWQAAAAKEPGREEQIRKQQEQDEKNAIESHLQTVLHDAHIPKRHSRTVIFELPQWQAAKNKLLARIGSGFMATLVGVRGAGKTQLGVELIRGAAPKIHRAKYATAFEFFLDVKAGYNDDGDSEKAVIHSFQLPDLLVIDELGKRSETEWENRLLYELLNRRYNDMKDTLIISNQDAASLEAALGDSLVSRMRETGGIIDCQWESFRK